MARNNQPAWKDKLRQEGVDDMTLLSKVTNEQIRDNLYERYKSDIIYTSISDVLISVNPYKEIPIYGKDIVHDYEGKSRIELPPHIFSIAEESYRTMLMEKENQSIIISGESGAGKTEAAKKIMYYIAEVTGGEKGGRLEKVKNIILETNPLLEAFGNAKTLRNNNSSRFGKYFELQFTIDGNPDGGVITNYLLEKARVTYQIPGERNFHIFYQFCAGANQQERTKYGIQGADAFSYLSYGNTFEVDNVDDASDWAEVRKAMSVIGLSANEQTDILSTLATIMWIGNIDFTSGEKAQVQDKRTLDFVASLLGVPSMSLQSALQVRTMTTQHGGRAGTSYKVPLNNVQAGANRDGLAKTMYSRMFDWLVQRVNKALISSNKQLSIGVLDIYGFEVFDKNSFEQLCINYVNEKLQQIFINFTLKNEQEEYVKENIKWTPIEYFNNKIVCDLIEAKSPPGLLLVLDDVCRSVHAVAEGADQALSQRASGLASNPHFSGRGGHFLIKHYAGDVTYEYNGLVEKNKDQLGSDLVELVQASNNAFLVGLFPDSANSEDPKKQSPTAGYQIRTSANLLVDTLSKTQPHYVRCLKPNDQKLPDHFDAARVLHQIRYLGLLDNIKVRRSGFAYRTVFKKFMERYFLLSPKTCYAAKLIWKGDDLSGCKQILQDAPVGPDEWQIGKTKVFLRHPETLFAFEDLRINYYNNMVSRIKNSFRIWKSYKDVCVSKIKNAFRAWKAYRVQMVSIIQKAFRNFKNVGPAYDLKIVNENIIQGKKQRNRFSLTSMRKFTGDYLDIKSQQELLRVMGPGASEPVLFTAKSRVVVHPGIFGFSKISPRFIILTTNAMYIIKLEVKKNLAQHILERTIPINNITGASMSTQFDNFLVLHANPQIDYDCVIDTDFKTELLAWLNTYGSVRSNVQFMDKIKYQKKKNSNKELEFKRDTQHKHANENPYFKKGSIKTSDGMPATSQVAQFVYKTEGQMLVMPAIAEVSSVVVNKSKRPGPAPRKIVDGPTSDLPQSSPPPTAKQPKAPPAPKSSAPASRAPPQSASRRGPGAAAPSRRGPSNPTPAPAAQGSRIAPAAPSPARRVAPAAPAPAEEPEPVAAPPARRALPAPGAPGRRGAPPAIPREEETPKPAPATAAPPAARRALPSPGGVNASQRRGPPPTVPRPEPEEEAAPAPTPVRRAALPTPPPGSAAPPARRAMPTPPSRGPPPAVPSEEEPPSPSKRPPPLPSLNSSRRGPTPPTPGRSAPSAPAPSGAPPRGPPPGAMRLPAPPARRGAAPPPAEDDEWA